MRATPRQIERIKSLGLIVEVLPTAMYRTKGLSPLDTLTDEAIPIKALIDADIPVVLGSDGNPNSMLWVMWETLTRWDEDRQCRLGDSGLTREDVLRIIQNGHIMSWNEDKLGSIELGKLADIIVLDENPLSCPEDQIKDISADICILGGKVVHERKDNNT
jgi:predicted amidohydrolase YtcJ